MVMVTVVLIPALLAGAGWPLRTVALVACASAVVAVAAMSPLAGLVLADLIGGIALATAVARAAVRARARRNLPEVADAVAAALERGDDLGTALRAGAAGASGAMASSLLAVASRVDAGVGAVAALGAWPAASRDHEARVLAGALHIGVAHPTERIAALRSAAVSLRLRRLRREEVLANVAQARASAAVVALGPWVVLAVVAVIDRAHLAVLFGTELGRWCAALAVASSLVGAGWIELLVARVRVR